MQCNAASSQIRNHPPLHSNRIPLRSKMTQGGGDSTDARGDGGPRAAAMPFSSDNQGALKLEEKNVDASRKGASSQAGNMRPMPARTIGDISATQRMLSAFAGSLLTSLLSEYWSIACHWMFRLCKTQLILMLFSFRTNQPHHWTWSEFVSNLKPRYHYKHLRSVYPRRLP